MRAVRVLLWVLCAAYWVALFTLTHVPRVPVQFRGDLGDKVGHLLAYAVLAGVLYLAMWASKARRGRPAAFIIVVTFVYAAMDELTQQHAAIANGGSAARGFDPVVPARA